MIECGTWTDCDAAAQSRGAHLVTIGDAAEQAWLAAQFAGNTYWIGFTDSAQEGTFVWVTGEPVDFTNWSNAQPDNYGDEDYTHMYDGGLWNDLANGYTILALIEQDGMNQQTVVYSNDFSTSAGSEWTDATIATVNGESFLGTSEYGFGAGSNTLTLDNLPDHTQVTVSFDLYLIQSWDGNHIAVSSQDSWQLTADGINLLFTNFSNNTAHALIQAYPDQLPPYGSGGSNAARTGAFENEHLGSPIWGDSTYRLSYTFDHTASSLALVFTGMEDQAPGDEGWGLDNVQVSVTSAIEPESNVISWVNWTAGNETGVSGTLNDGDSAVSVTFSGLYLFAQTDDGNQYWEPSQPYLSDSVVNAPSTPDIIALNDGGTKTITFSRVVHNPLIALASWNGNTVDFGVPIRVLSYGSGHFGNGTFVINEQGTGFYGEGEVHGVIELIGDYSSITLNDSSEYWHGFTIGVRDQLGEETPTAFDLNVTVPAVGGAVTSADTRINCAPNCTASYPDDTAVTLTANPAAGYTFTGWSQDCLGTAPTCTLTLDAAKNVTASFTAASYPLSISKDGSGTVKSAPAGINCGATCSAKFTNGKVVTLTAVAAQGYTFSKWTGACSGANTTCKVTMKAAKTATAVFKQRPTIDFVITGITLNPTSPTARSAFNASITIKNQGTQAGNAGFLDVWTNQATATTCGSDGDAWITVGTLDAGASKTLIVPVRTNTKGAKTLRAMVDSWCDTTETSETNNQLTKSYTVK